MDPQEVLMMQCRTWSVPLISRQLAGQGMATWTLLSISEDRCSDIMSLSNAECRDCSLLRQKVLQIEHSVPVTSRACHSLRLSLPFQLLMLDLSFGSLLFRDMSDMTGDEPHKVSFLCCLLCLL